MIRCATLVIAVGLGGQVHGATATFSNATDFTLTMVPGFGATLSDFGFRRSEVSYDASAQATTGTDGRQVNAVLETGSNAATGAAVPLGAGAELGALALLDGDTPMTFPDRSAGTEEASASVTSRLAGGPGSVSGDFKIEGTAFNQEGSEASARLIFGMSLWVENLTTEALILAWSLDWNTDLFTAVEGRGSAFTQTSYELRTSEICGLEICAGPVSLGDAFGARDPGILGLMADPPPQGGTEFLERNAKNLKHRVSPNALKSLISGSVR